MAPTRFAATLTIASERETYLADVTSVAAPGGRDLPWQLTVRNGGRLTNRVGHVAWVTLEDRTRRTLDAGALVEGSYLIATADWQPVINGPANLILWLVPTSGARPKVVGYAVEDMTIDNFPGSLGRHRFEGLTPEGRELTLCLVCGLRREGHVVPVPAPPKFASTAEADAWMHKHEGDAAGTIDEVLRLRGSLHV